MEPKVIKAYVCQTALNEDFQGDPSGIVIYKNAEDLKEYADYWSECGIYEIEITVSKIVAPSMI